jgi:hypothetical protein
LSLSCLIRVLPISPLPFLFDRPNSSCSVQILKLLIMQYFRQCNWHLDKKKVVWFLKSISRFSLVIK